MAAKISRDRIAVLCVEAYACGDLLGAILNAMRNRGFTPVDVALYFDRRPQLIEIFIERTAACPLELIDQQIQALAGVTCAEWRDHADRFSNR